MKRMFFVLAVLAGLLCCALADFPAPREAVLLSDAPLYGCPTGEGRLTYIEITVPAGAQVDVYGQEEGRALIRYYARYGWVRGYVSLSALPDMNLPQLTWTDTLMWSDAVYLPIQGDPDPDSEDASTNGSLGPWVLLAVEGDMGYFEGMTNRETARFFAPLASMRSEAPLPTPTLDSLPQGTPLTLLSETSLPLKGDQSAFYDPLFLDGQMLLPYQAGTGRSRTIYAALLTREGKILSTVKLGTRKTSDDDWQEFLHTSDGFVFLDYSDIELTRGQSIRYVFKGNTMKKAQTASLKYTEEDARYSASARGYAWEVYCFREGASQVHLVSLTTGAERELPTSGQVLPHALSGDSLAVLTEGDSETRVYLFDADLTETRSWLLPQAESIASNWHLVLADGALYALCTGKDATNVWRLEAEAVQAYTLPSGRMAAWTLLDADAEGLLLLAEAGERAVLCRADSEGGVSLLNELPGEVIWCRAEEGVVEAAVFASDGRVLLQHYSAAGRATAE